MKRFLSFLLLSALLVSCQSQAQDGLTAAEFEKRIQRGESQLLDVRTAGEFQSGHLKNSLQADWLNNKEFTERIKYLDKSKPLLVYCASGVRSAAAAKYLLAKGFTSVQNLKGGLIAWKLEGKTVEQPAGATQMTLDAYKAFTTSAGVVLVDFGAEWCPPCKKMEPVLNQLQKELAGQFKLVKVDGGMDVDVMKSQQVESLPVFIIYKNGKETWRKQGVVELSELKEKLGK
jgi:rhodanese-related sulfurtransferase